MAELASDLQIMTPADGLVGWSTNTTTPSAALLTDTASIPRQSAHACQWRPSVFQQLRLMAAMQPGWDGEGGLAPRIEILNSAAGLVDEILRHAPTIAEPYLRPTPDGGILLAWQSAAGGADLEVEIETPGMASFVYSTGGPRGFEKGIICHDGRPVQEDDRIFLRLLQRLENS